MDAGRDAGLDVGMDAGDDDGGSEDADVQPIDAGPPPDGGPDLPDAAVIEGCEAVCTAPGFYCERPDGSCIGPARCVPLPEADVTCRDAVVCGCDRNPYPNACVARAAGVNVAFFDSCPDFSARDWCSLAEPPMGATWSCHPCFDEADCSDIPLATDWVCVGSSCTPGGEGSCQPAGGFNDCYYDHQCGGTMTCADPEIRVCEGSEFLVQGRCL